MIVTTGSAGQLGRLVARALAVRTAPAGVRLTTRVPAKIAGFAEQGFTIARADFNDAAELRSAFDGGKVLLIVSSNTSNEVRFRQHRTAIDAAKQASMERIVYTSFTNSTPSSRLVSYLSHLQTEEYLKVCGLKYTILRVNQYAENLDFALEDSKRADEIVLPGAKGKVAYVARGDVAAVIASVLTQAGHNDKVYEITGPEAVDLYDIGKSLSEARKRPVKVTDADPAEYGRMLAAGGMEPWLVEGYLSLFAATAADEYAAISPDAVRLAGRALTPMTAYVKKFA